LRSVIETAAIRMFCSLDSSSSGLKSHTSSLFISGRPENQTQRDSVISRLCFSVANAGATSPRLPVVAFRSAKVAILSRSERRLSVGHLGVEHARGAAENEITVSCSQSRRAPICTSARSLLCQWTCRELNPEALSASQSADPSASP